MPGVIESVKKSPKRAAADIAAFAIVALFLIHEFGRESRGARADNITAEDQAPTGHLYAVARPPFDLPIKRGGLAE